MTSLRLDPQRKHFAQLVARSRGITFAELVDELLAVSLETATLPVDGKDVPVAELVPTLWAEHEADRIALLGNRFPELLTERERIMWERIVCRQRMYWKVPIFDQPIEVNHSTFDFELFRKRFQMFEELTRNGMLVMANEVGKGLGAASEWYGDGEPQQEYRSKLRERRQKKNDKLNNSSKK